MLKKFLIICFSISIFFILAHSTMLFGENKIASNWNDANFFIFDNKINEEKAKRELSEYGFQSMIWPKENEISKYKSEASEKQKKECVEWISKILKKEWIPNDISSHLVPLQNWGKSNEHWKEKKRKGDVFITNYKIENYIFFIVEGVNKIQISIKNINVESSLSEDKYIDFVLNNAEKFLNKIILPDNENEIKWKKANKGSWIPQSELNSPALFVHYFTDGKIIQFEITKSFEGPRLFYDPYEPRFSK